jgi:hypothetical protein
LNSWTNFPNIRWVSSSFMFLQRNDKIVLNWKKPIFFLVIFYFSV